MEESTKKLSKMLGTESAERMVHAYLYARYVPHYVYHLGKGAGLVEKPPPEEIPREVREMIEILANKVLREVASTETSTYHGKIVPLKHAEELVTIKEDVDLRDLERVIPYKIARDIVLENPRSIALFDCACRTVHENPCEPVNVCMAVGEPFVSFLVDHDILGARRITSEEAASVLRAEHERGHVHGAYFKDVMEGRFYAICNCCPCCCMGMKAWLRFKVPIICSSGYVARVSEECTACGDCAEICPFDAIAVDDAAAVDEEACMGCGVCEGACPTGAIYLEVDPERPEPLDINKLLDERAAARKGE